MIQTSEQWEFIIDRPEKQRQGVWLYYKGVSYPRRVYWSNINDPNYTLRALNALGTVKKYIFSLSYILDFALPRTLNVKKYETFLRRIGAMCTWTLDEFLIKDEEWSEPVWEIGKFVRQFLEALGLSKDVALEYSKIVMCILEFDNAYRYRIQDLLGLVHRLNRRTLKYVLTEYKKREGLPGAAQKIDKIGALLGWLLWIPKISKALEKAHKGVDFNKIGLDINDRYHTSFWRGYDYGGKNFDERYQFFLDTHKGDFPPFKKRINPEDTAKFMLGEL